MIWPVSSRIARLTITPSTRRSRRAARFRSALARFASASRHRRSDSRNYRETSDSLRRRFWTAVSSLQATGEPGSLPGWGLGSGLWGLISESGASPVGSRSRNGSICSTFAPPKESAPPSESTRASRRLRAPECRPSTSVDQIFLGFHSRFGPGGREGREAPARAEWPTVTVARNGGLLHSPSWVLLPPLLVARDHGAIVPSRSHRSSQF
jgi:hypothetical protein